MAAGGHTGPGGAARAAAQVGQTTVVRHGTGRGDGTTDELMEVDMGEV